MKSKRKKITPTYLCGGCGMALKYTITCHYLVENDKEHKCKPILKPPNKKSVRRNQQ
jgi:hypothetical protein